MRDFTHILIEILFCLIAILLVVWTDHTIKEFQRTHNRMIDRQGKFEKKIVILMTEQKKLVEECRRLTILKNGFSIELKKFMKYHRDPWEYKQKGFEKLKEKHSKKFGTERGGEPVPSPSLSEDQR